MYPTESSSCKNTNQYYEQASLTISQLIAFNTNIGI